MNTIIDIERSHPKAIEKFNNGEKYQASSFEEWVTYGYGELSDYGFWEFDLYFINDEYNN